MVNGFIENTAMVGGSGDSVAGKRGESGESGYFEWREHLNSYR